MRLGNLIAGQLWERVHRRRARPRRAHRRRRARAAARLAERARPSPRLQVHHHRAARAGGRRPDHGAARSCATSSTSWATSTDSTSRREAAWPPWAGARAATGRGHPARPPAIASPEAPSPDPSRKEWEIEYVFSGPCKSGSHRRRRPDRLRDPVPDRQRSAARSRHAGPSLAARDSRRRSRRPRARRWNSTTAPSRCSAGVDIYDDPKQAFDGVNIALLVGRAAAQQGHGAQ